jgi:hypothetical protein
MDEPALEFDGVALSPQKETVLGFIRTCGAQCQTKDSVSAANISKFLGSSDP